MIRGLKRRIAGVAALAATLSMLGCGRGGETEPVADFPPFLAFGCAGDTRFLAVFAGPDTARLVSAEGIRSLARIPAASGAKYAGPADTLWTKGQEAMVIRGGEIHRGCTATGRQKILAGLHRDGAVFAASGSEPFWTLTAWPDSLVLLLDMGATRVTRRIAADTAPSWDDRASFAYAGDATGITVGVQPGPCLDIMSGEPFPAAVVVTWQGREFRGCGMSLRSP